MNPISRRRFIGLASFAVVGASGLLAACGGAASPASSQAASAPGTPAASAAPSASSAAPAASVSSSASAVASASASAPTSAAASPAASASAAPANLAAEQKLITAISNMVASVDPMFELGSTARRYDLYEMLVMLAPNGDAQPMLATSWKRLDDSTYQFTLRPNVTFHNGDPMTADDVKFSLERAIRKTPKPLATGGILDTAKSAQVIDPHTINIVSNGPDALFIKKLARLAIMPQKYYTSLGSTDDARDKGFALKPIGTGPYQFVSFTPNDKLVMKAYQAHSWRKPILTDITIRQMAEPAAQKAAFLAGEVQYINLIPLNAVAQVKAMGGKILTVTKGNSLGAFMDTVDQSGAPKKGPIGDVRVRHALNYAIDKETLAKEVLGGLTLPESGQIPSHDTYGFDPSVKAYPYDPTMAGQLMDEAGFKKGANGRFKLTMASGFAAPGSPRRDIGEYVQGQLSKVGVNVDYSPLTDVGLTLDYFYDRKPRPDIFHFGLFTRPYLDPEGAYNWFRSTNPTKHYNNPAFDAAFLASQKELDPQKRLAPLYQQTKIIHDDAPWLFLTEDLWIDAAGPKLEGAIADDAEVDQFYDRLYLVK